MKRLFSDRSGVHLGRLFGVGLNIRWSALALAAALVALHCLGHVRMATFLVAWLALLVVHDLGHWLAAALLNLHICAYHFSAVNSDLHFERPDALHKVILFRAAGLLAQGLLLLGTCLCLWQMGVPVTTFWSAVVIVFVGGNVFLAIILLMPIEDLDSAPTDGLLVCGLIRYSRHPRPLPCPELYAPSVILPVDTIFSENTHLVPPNFVVGVAFLNDAATPISFVSSVFGHHFAMTSAEVRIQADWLDQRGGLLLPLSSWEQAKSTAALIQVEAKLAGHPFRCYAVDLRQQNREIVD